MTLEINLDHTWAGDLSFALQSPDGTKRDFIYRAGGSNDYVAQNLYRFNNTFTNVIAYSSTLPQIAAGDYRECKDPLATAISLESIFASFNGKQVNGTWKLIITDNEALVSGSLKKWKLRFAEGALNQ